MTYQDKNKLVPCPLPKCASEDKGKKRPLVPIGDVCQDCKEWSDGFE